MIAAAGDLDHKHLVELAERHFGGYRRATTKGVQVKKEKPYFCGSRLLQNDDIFKFCHCAVGYESVSWTHPAQPVFMLMQSIIGTYDRLNEGLVPAQISGNRSRNNISNRELVGCAENFAAFNTCYKDTGLFGFYVHANYIAMYHALEELLFSVCCLAYSVTEEEVQTAKKSLKVSQWDTSKIQWNIMSLTLHQMSLFGNLETTTAICEDIGRQML